MSPFNPLIRFYSRSGNGGILPDLPQSNFIPRGMAGGVLQVTVLPLPTKGQSSGAVSGTVERVADRLEEAGVAVSCCAQLLVNDVQTTVVKLEGTGK